MSASLTIVPASGAITAARTVCRVTVAGATANDDTAYNALLYPASPEVRYYLAFELSSVEQGRSYVFAPNGGAHVFNNYIFPEAGSWTVHLRKTADDSSVANIAVTVA